MMGGKSHFCVYFLASASPYHCERASEVTGDTMVAMQLTISGGACSSGLDMALVRRKTSSSKFRLLIESVACA